MGMHGNNSKQKIGNQRIILRDEDCIYYNVWATIKNETESISAINILHSVLFTFIVQTCQKDKTWCLRCLATVVTLF